MSDIRLIIQNIRDNIIPMYGNDYLNVLIIKSQIAIQPIVNNCVFAALNNKRITKWKKMID